MKGVEDQSGKGREEKEGQRWSIYRVGREVSDRVCDRGGHRRSKGVSTVGREWTQVPSCQRARPSDPSNL